MAGRTARPADGAGRARCMANQAGLVEAGSIGTHVAMRVMARRALQALGTFVEAAAQDQALTWKAHRMRRSLDEADHLEIVVFWRIAVANAAHLRLGESA